MLIGNRHEIAASLFAPGYTMAAAIANEFSEAVGDMHLSALAYVGVRAVRRHVLVNAGARLLIWRVGARLGRGEQRRCEPPGRSARVKSNLMVGLMIGPCIVARLPLLFILVTCSQGRREPVARLLHPDAGARPARAAAVWRTRSSARCSSWASPASSACRSASRAGIYLRRVSGRAGSRWVTRFVADVLNGTPSIVIGVFAWAWIVATAEALLRAGRQRGAGAADDSDGACARPRR